VQLPGLRQLAARSHKAGILLALPVGMIAALLVLEPSAATCYQAFLETGNGNKAASAHALVLSQRMLAQDDDDSGDSDIPPNELEKYVATYRAMQQNRSLTVEQAAAREGLSLAAFRALEQKVERDDNAREQVRDELQAAAQASEQGTAPQSTSSK